MRKSNTPKTLSTSSGRKSFTPKRPSYTHDKFHHKQEKVKNVDDVLAEIFSDKTTLSKPIKSKPKHKTSRSDKSSSIKPLSEELPVFKTNIKDFEVNKPTLPSDINEFKPHIITPIDYQQSVPPILKKLRNLNNDDLKYGIILSEVLGPPTSLK